MQDVVSGEVVSALDLEATNPPDAGTRMQGATFERLGTRELLVALSDGRAGELDALDATGSRHLGRHAIPTCVPPPLD